MPAGEEPAVPVRGPVARELSRRDFLRHTTLLGAGALVASALPIAVAAEPAAAAVPFDGALLQAYADTLIPGRKATRTDLGDEIHPRAIAGVDPEPGAVEADALRLFRNTLLGFPALAPVFIADLTARALLQGGAFLDLPYERRVRTVIGGLSFDNPTRLVWEAGAAIPFVAFCAAGTQPNATAKTASGLRVMGHPGTAPNGYRGASYRRKLAKERTRKGNLR
jgi:hypothetical protein